MNDRNESDTAPHCDQKDTLGNRGQPVGLIKSLTIGLCVSTGLALVLVALTGLTGGRSPAERAATSLAMPIGMLWLSLLAAAVACRKRHQRRMAAVFLLAWLSVGVMFNGRVAGWFLRSMEHPAASNSIMSEDSPLKDAELKAVVLLGGYAGENRYGVPELGTDGQRLMLAAQLWHAGKTKTIICTGSGAEGAMAPSMIGRQMLVSIGVPNNVIFEVPGLNTAAEMQNLEQFFNDPPKNWLAKIGDEPTAHQTGFPTSEQTIGLVTTAVHLSRAMRLAETRSLEFMPLGCRFNGRPPGAFSGRELIPTASAGKAFAIALKEWLAGLVGR